MMLAMATPPKCTCIQSEWNADRTAIINTFELDSECPIHGDDACEAQGAVPHDDMSDQDLEILENLLRHPAMETIDGVDETDVAAMITAVHDERERRRTE